MSAGVLWNDPSPAPEPEPVDPLAIVVELTDTDLGVMAQVTWPVVQHLANPDPTATHTIRFPEHLVADRITDWVREHCPGVEVWCVAGFIAIRQQVGPDVVAWPGDTLTVIAGQVTR